MLTAIKRSFGARASSGLNGGSKWNSRRRDPTRQIVKRTTASLWREQTLPTHRSRRRISQRPAGLPWNLTFAKAIEKSETTTAVVRDRQASTGTRFDMNDCSQTPRTGADDPEQSPRPLALTSKSSISSLLGELRVALLPCNHLGKPTAVLMVKMKSGSSSTEGINANPTSAYELVIESALQAASKAKHMRNSHS